MQIVSFLLLIGPGILAWKVARCLRREQERPGLVTVLEVAVNALLIYVAACLALNLLYGRTPLSFSSQYIPEISCSVFNSAFTWKYGAMTCALGTGLGILKGLMERWRKK